MTVAPLRIRWLGSVPYAESLALQRGLVADRGHQHLLLLEHPHVFTYGRTADLRTNLLCDPGEVGAELIAVDRGGDITYHGPGQLVGYPILDLPGRYRSVDHVCRVEQVIIDTLAELGLGDAGRLKQFPGVWMDPHGPSPRKIAAIGVRVANGRSMHGFAINVTTDMEYLRSHIVPCGIADRPVTSIAEELERRGVVPVDMRRVVDTLVEVATQAWSPDAGSERQDVQWRHRPEDLSAFSRGEGPGEPVRLRGRLAAAGVGEGLEISERKPDWLRPKVSHGPEVLSLRRTLRNLDLVTVCEDAGCPNLSECWSEGTATFMVLGDRCTRACGFCLVDTRHPLAPAVDEPSRVAEAVAQMGLEHAVLTMVARDDLADGGMAHVAACVNAIRQRCPGTKVETLISDVRGDSDALAVLLGVHPDVLNHNIETVARLQRAVRPSAGYARSLALLARAGSAGLITKSSLMLGLGETESEIEGCLSDLAAIGVRIVTLGQYLRPTSHHVPVARWVEPAEFARWKQIGESLGIDHVESSPLTRSSYHAGRAAAGLSAPKSDPLSEPVSAPVSASVSVRQPVRTGGTLMG